MERCAEVGLGRLERGQVEPARSGPLLKAAATWSDSWCSRDAKREAPEVQSGATPIWGLGERSSGGGPACSETQNPSKRDEYRAGLANGSSGEDMEFVALCAVNTLPLISNYQPLSKQPVGLLKPV